MISTFVLAGMIPKIWLAVEGSARTLTSVVVVPSTGIIVGAGGGVAVSVGMGGKVAGSVKVMMGDVGVEIGPSLKVVLQPVYKKIKRVKITLGNRIGTIRFYRLSQE